MKLPYDVVRDGELLMTLTTETDDSMPQVLNLHAEVFKWSKENYLYILEWWLHFIEYQKATGVKKLLATSDKDFYKLAKFWRVAGFTDIQVVDAEGRKYLLGVMEV